jgi:hypothetical protein
MTDGRRKVTKAVGYSVEIHQKAFAFWYKFRPEMKQLVTMLQEDLGEGVRVPGFGVLRTWKMVEDWEGHADALDGQAEQAGDKEIILQRAQIIRDGAEVGKELVKMGMDYLKKEGIENSADAIRAIGKGMELEEKLLGWAAVFQRVSEANDQELNQMIKKYMTGEIIEATATDATEQSDDTERPE